MIVFSHPLALALALPAIALSLLVWRQGYINLRGKRRALSLAVRVVLLLLLILGLAGLNLRLPRSREATVFVADLSASNAASRTSMQKLINSAGEQRPGEDVAGVVGVGREGLIEQPVTQLSSFDGFQSTVDPDYTNLEGGINLAAALLPDGYRRRIVVLTDGQQNVGDALSSARLLRTRGIRVDVVPQSMHGGADVLVDSVDVPSQLRTRERFSLAVSLRSNVHTSTRIDIFRDGSLTTSRRESVRNGENRFVFSQGALGIGFHNYRVEITPQIDSQPQNNVGSASTDVRGAARVLVIDSAPSEATNVVRGLQSSGISVDLRTPSGVIPTLSFLQHYAGVVIVDTSAPDLGANLLEQLVPYVRDLGKGLVVIGGGQSYGLGAYGQTPLEEVLPVKMDLPRRRDLPSAAVALIIETLESPLPVNISKAAGRGVVKLLTEQDQVAVSDASPTTGRNWVVPLQAARDKKTINRFIQNMQPADPDSYGPALRSALETLKSTHAGVKHIVLLGDGDAVDRRYEGIVKRIRAARITVSAVITNGTMGSDFATMRNIARWGGGRYYRADNPRAIPKIFLREARAIARSGVVEGTFVPERLSQNPMVRDLRQTPPLQGYVTTALKPAGELILASRHLDPILASWQFGLGRAVAWTSDASGRWTREWLSSGQANRFWSDMVSWTLPSSDEQGLYVSTSTAQGSGRISVDTPPNLGTNPTVTARVVDPKLRTARITLQPSSPTHYRGAFASSGEGGYIVTVEARGNGHAAIGQAPLDVPYPAEYRATGTNMTFLRSLALAGGGAIIKQAGSAWADNLPEAFDQRSLQRLFWLIALLLLPVDIAIRRLMISRRDLRRIRAAVGLPVLPSLAAEPSGTSVPSSRLRSSPRARPAPVPVEASSPIPPLRATPLEQYSRARHVTQPSERPAAPAPANASKAAPIPPVPVVPVPRAAVPATDKGLPDPVSRDDGASTVSRLLAAKRRRG